MSPTRLRIAVVAMLCLRVGSALAQEAPGCVPVAFEGPDLEVLLFLKEAGSAGACESGRFYGAELIRADASDRAHWTCYRNFGSYNSGEFSYRRPSERGAMLDRARESESSSFCAVLGGGRVPLGRTSRLSGSLRSDVPPLALEIRGGRVSASPLAACCDADRQCTGQIVAGRERCEAGSAPIGPLTSCSKCATAPPDWAETLSEREQVSCCVGGRCEQRPNAVACGLAGGKVLPPGLACSSGADPCGAVTGACVSNDGVCTPHWAEGECRQSPGAIYLGDGSTCPMSEPRMGGCCTPDGDCRPRKEAECLQTEGATFFAAGCPGLCPVATGACRIPCPNPAGVQCMAATQAACSTYPGTVFDAGQECPADPAALRCRDAECGGCAELHGGWPALDGTLVLGPDCEAELVEEAGISRSGTYKCPADDDPRTLTISWVDGTGIELEITRDGEFIFFGWEPRLSGIWTSTYGEIHWGEGWYKNENQTISQGTLTRDGNAWVLTGTWGRRKDPSYTGGFKFRFESPCSFSGSWWHTSSPKSLTGWTGSCKK